MKIPEILICDDEPINLATLNRILRQQYTVKACRSGDEVLRILATDHKPDLILLDVMMPGMNGYTVLTMLREQSENQDIPVIFITGLDSAMDEEKGFQLGAVDYIAKPFKPILLLERVKVHLELKAARDRLKDQNAWLEAEVEKRVYENLLIQDATLCVITELAESRDNETARHILRTRQYIEILARRLQKMPKFADALNEDRMQWIVKAAPMHDVGKIGIPDAVLLKPGIFTPEEFEIMKTHCLIGGSAIRNAMNQAMEMHTGEGDSLTLTFLKEAEIIATYHHEKWDGSGYPYGLVGEAIPLSARLMALADVFDALTTTRIYKGPCSFEEAVDYIVDQKGQHFDPDVVEAFNDERAAFYEVLSQMSDAKPGRRLE